MPTSIRIDGEWRDLRFRKKAVLDGGQRWYHVYVGKEAWGQVMSSTRGRHGSTGGFNREEWTALSFHPQFNVREDEAFVPEHLRPLPDNRAHAMVYGFATRRAAAVYIVKTWGYWRSS